MQISKNRIYLAGLLLFIGHLQIFAQEKSLKKIYTTIQDAVNAAILTQKGSSEISGQVYYSTQRTEYTGQETLTDNWFQATPSYSYFLWHNFSLGFILSYTYHEREHTQVSPVFLQSNSTSQTEQLGVGLVMKKYFGNERYRPYGYFDYQYLSGDSDDGHQVNVGLGLLYHLSGNIGFGPQVIYGTFFSNQDRVEKQHKLYFGFGLSLFVL